MQIDKQEIEEQIDILLNEIEKKYGKECKSKFILLTGLIKMLNPDHAEKEKEREIPLTMWNEYYPDPSIPALRMLVFRKDENGFDEVISRRGNRILIKENAYFKWRKEHPNYL